VIRELTRRAGAPRPPIAETEPQLLAQEHPKLDAESLKASEDCGHVTVNAGCEAAEDLDSSWRPQSSSGRLSVSFHPLNAFAPEAETGDGGLRSASWKVRRWTKPTC
jgi:hypothetical protein